MDTYALSESGGGYTLTVEGMLGGVLEFDVTVEDVEHITLRGNAVTFELEKVE